MFTTSAFGKNDIRGIYGEDITEEIFFYTGKGYVKYLSSELKAEPKNIWVTVWMQEPIHLLSHNL